jgi:hypothetical protein
MSLLLGVDFGDSTEPAADSNFAVLSRRDIEKEGWGGNQKERGEVPINLLETQDARQCLYCTRGLQ